MPHSASQLKSMPVLPWASMASLTVDGTSTSTTLAGATSSAHLAVVRVGTSDSTAGPWADLAERIGASTCKSDTSDWCPSSPPCDKSCLAHLYTRCRSIGFKAMASAKSWMFSATSSRETAPISAHHRLAAGRYSCKLTLVSHPWSSATLQGTASGPAALPQASEGTSSSTASSCPRPSNPGGGVENDDRMSSSPAPATAGAASAVAAAAAVAGGEGAAAAAAVAAETTERALSAEEGSEGAGGAHLMGWRTSSSVTLGGRAPPERSAVVTKSPRRSSRPCSTEGQGPPIAGAGSEGRSTSEETSSEAPSPSPMAEERAAELWRAEVGAETGGSGSDGIRHTAEADDEGRGTAEPSATCASESRLGCPEQPPDLPSG
mmetsp:Transcript_156579/g.502603  ORF Transcript_156579/g.502603 Transcript_156579/m.502603 type:complete len:377 (+) Transcript_156579:387-1517(+)